MSSKGFDVTHMCFARRFRAPNGAYQLSLEPPREGGSNEAICGGQDATVLETLLHGRFECAFASLATGARSGIVLTTDMINKQRSSLYLSYTACERVAE